MGLHYVGCELAMQEDQSEGISLPDGLRDLVTTYDRMSIQFIRVAYVSPVSGPKP